MKLEIKTDRDLVIQKLQDGREILFEIAWEKDGLYYPMNPWQDFGMVILGWWSTAISSLVNGEQDKVKLSFMDGPYALFLTVDRQTQLVMVSSKDGKFEAMTSIDDIKKQMTTAIRSIQQEILTINTTAKEPKYLGH